jgi:drug/metabolite transporter (DMT)-like permease
MKSKTLFGLFMLSTAAILWGGTVVPAKWLLGYMSPITVVTLRFSVATIALLPMAFWQYHRNSGFVGMHWRRLILQGFLGVTLYYLIGYWGLQLSSGVHVSLISAALPLVIAIVSGIILGETLSRRQWIASIIAILGVVLIIFTSQDSGSNSLMGDFLVAASILFWAFYTVLTKQWKSNLPSVVMTAWIVTFGTLILLPVAVFQGNLAELKVLTTWPGITSLLYLGVGASALAFLLWNTSLRYVSASFAGMTLNLLPVVGFLLSILILGESVSILALFGGMSSVAAVFWAAYESKSTEVQPVKKKITIGAYSDAE